MFYYVISQKEMKGIKREYKSEYDYKPCINDIIRLGRVQFIIRSMKDKSTSNNDNQNSKCLYLPNDNSNNNNNLINHSIFYRINKENNNSKEIFIFTK